VPERDRLAERVDVLVLDFFLDVGRQQPRRELGVVGLFDDQRRRGADRQLVELFGGRAIAQTADGARGNAHDIDTGEVDRTAVDRPHDLVDIDGLEVTVALAHTHRHTVAGACVFACTLREPIVGDRHNSCPPSSHDKRRRGAACPEPELHPSRTRGSLLHGCNYTAVKRKFFSRHESVISASCGGNGRNP
jgi:hypothetical protein